MNHKYIIPCRLGLPGPKMDISINRTSTFAQIKCCKNLVHQSYNYQHIKEIYIPLYDFENTIKITVYRKRVATKS